LPAVRANRASKGSKKSLTGDAILERWLAPADALHPDRIDTLRKLFPGSRLGLVLAEIQEEVEQDLGELDVAIGERDQARVAAVAHRIRNTAQLLGASGLAGRAAELDNPPREDREPVELDDGALIRLREQWASTRAALAELAGNPVRSFT
jgi:HPt (histidine-containing phosphotransfer) domain-containing protein